MYLLFRSLVNDIRIFVYIQVWFSRFYFVNWSKQYNTNVMGKVIKLEVKKIKDSCKKGSRGCEIDKDLPYMKAA